MQCDVSPAVSALSFRRPGFSSGGELWGPSAPSAMSDEEFSDSEDEDEERRRGEEAWLTVAVVYDGAGRA